MKKNVIALMLSIVMLVGSIGGSSVFAAEITDETSAAESTAEETADEELAIPEITDDETDSKKEQEDVPDETGSEQKEDPQESALNDEASDENPEAADQGDDLIQTTADEAVAVQEDEEIIEPAEDDRDGQSGRAAGGKIAQVIWTEDNTTLTFYYGPLLHSGDSFEGETVTNVWSGEAVTNNGSDTPAWVVTVKDLVTCVVCDSSFLAVKPLSTNEWFDGFNKLTSVDLTGLDTSEAIFLSNMFCGCSSLTELDVSSLDTSKAFHLS